MKIRLLPETDLARISPMPLRQKERALQKMKLGRPPYSYGPTRKSIFDIFNVESGFLSGSPRTPWQAITESIAKDAKSPEECLANLRVSEALYKFATDNDLTGRRQDFLPLTIGVSQKISVWHPAVLAFRKEPFVFFTDPRTSSAKLTEDGRRFVFSVMHERIRAADDDYSAVGLAVIQMKKLDDGERTANIYEAKGPDLFSFEDLDFMIRETYELWIKIQMDRSEEARRKGTGTFGPLI